MFQSILTHLEKDYQFSPPTIERIQNACAYWDSCSPETENKLISLKQKYSYENLPEEIRKNPHEIRLEFFKAIGEFSLTPAMNNQDIDRDYLLFVTDFYDKIPTNGFDLSTLEDPEASDYFHVIDRLFYTWISYLWQKIKGSEVGIPVATVENNSCVHFYFNDFLFDDYSSFLNLTVTEKIQGSIFDRELTPEEIYMRTSREYRNKEKPFELNFQKEGEQCKLSLSDSSTSLIHSSSRVEEKLNHLPNTNYDNSRHVAVTYFLKKSNEMMNEGWRLMLTRT